MLHHSFKAVLTIMQLFAFVQSTRLTGLCISYSICFLIAFLGFKLFLIVSISVSVAPELSQFKLSGKHNKITVSAI